MARQGYQRLLVDFSVVRLEESLERLRPLDPSQLTVIQDRLTVSEPNRARFVEACEQAFHFGNGKLAVHSLGSSVPPAVAIRETKLFSNRFHCAECDLEYREPTPALFSYNHPVGACPACRGFGRIITIDYDAALPDRSKTLAQGVVKPWQTGTSAECQTDMARYAKLRKVPMNVPFQDLPKALQDWVIEGDPGYGADKDHEWPRAWYGVKGYFRWLESKSYKMHVRVLLSRYRAYQTCPQCHGARFQAETLLYRLRVPGGKGITIADFYRMPIDRALQLIEALRAARSGARRPTR